MTSRCSPVLTIFAAAALSISGCIGATRSLNTDFPAASAWFEGVPGSIAVLPGDDVPSLSLYSLEALGIDSAKASAKGASNTVGAGCVSGPESGCSNEVLATHRGTLVQSGGETEMSGIWSAYGSAPLQQANEQLNHSLADRRPQLLVSHAVVARIRARTAYDAQLKAFRGYPEEFVPSGPFNGVVEIGLTKFGLVIDGPSDESNQDPRVALTIGVRAAVFSMRKREFVQESKGGWEYVGTPHLVSELTAENGRLLNEEIERAAKTLAKRIVN
jgi:hypothetical protein